MLSDTVISVADNSLPGSELASGVNETYNSNTMYTLADEYSIQLDLEVAMSKQEEWDIFSRIEQLEKVTTKFMDAETTLLESRLIALWAFSLAFAALTEHRPDVGRQFKDVLMTQLKGAGLRQKALNALEEWMLYFCDVLEREK